MPRPLIKTKPTKLITALITTHVVTSFVFLNRDSAFGTDFSILFNPLDVSRVFYVLTIPLVHLSIYLIFNYFTYSHEQGSWLSY